jgi:hypothetical protein
MPESDDFESELRGDMPRTINKRDPVAIAVGLVNLLALIGGYAW